MSWKTNLREAAFRPTVLLRFQRCHDDERLTLSLTNIMLNPVIHFALSCFQQLVFLRKLVFLTYRAAV
jgi:hypothetical protein